MSCRQCINDGGPGPCVSAPCWLLCQQLGSVCNTIIMGGLGRSVEAKPVIDPVELLKPLSDIESAVRTSAPDEESPDDLAMGARGLFVFRPSDLLLSIGVSRGDLIISIDNSPADGERFNGLHCSGEHVVIWYDAVERVYKKVKFTI